MTTNLEWLSTPNTIERLVLVIMFFKGFQDLSLRRII
jgi:hypothetical protein